jgi:hypothetical protein
MAGEKLVFIWILIKRGDVMQIVSDLFQWQNSVNCFES